MANINFLDRVHLLLFSKLSKWIKRFGIILIIILSFLLSSHIAIALYKKSAQPVTPDQFPVVCYAPPNNIALQRWNDLYNKLVIKDSYILLPNDQASIVALNKQLTQQYQALVNQSACYFEILAEEHNRQYIHLTINTDDNIIESWYWLSANGIEPDQFRWLNPGVVLIVVPLTGILSFIICSIYQLLIKRYDHNKIS